MQKSPIKPKKIYVETGILIISLETNRLPAANYIAGSPFYGGKAHV